MRRSLLVVVALLALVLSACSGAATPGLQPQQRSVDVDTPALRSLKAAAEVEPCRRTTAQAPAGDALPDVSLQCLGGGPSVRLAGLRGPMVVSLFAQWCGPCRKELPYYQRLHERAGGKVAVLGIDYLDTQPEGALRLVQRSGVTFPLLADPEGRLRTDLRVRFLPTVVFVAADGTVTDVQARAFSSYGELRAVVQKQLGVSIPA